MANITERGERFSHLLALELRGAIKSHGFAATKVAEAVEIDYSTLYRHFTGKTSIPSDVFNRACEYIGVNPAELVDRAYRRLVDELGPWPPVDIELVSTYTPVEGVPVSDINSRRRPPQNIAAKRDYPAHLDETE